MASTKLSAKTALTTVASGDTLYIIDVSDTTDGANGTSKKITHSDLLAGLSSLKDSNGNEYVKFVSNASAVNEITIENSATGVNPIIAATGEADTGITFENDQSEEILILDAVASAVNEITIKNAATGNNPVIAATGEADTGITFENDQSEEILILDSVASSVNEITIKSAATGNFPVIAATGEADTGIQFENDQGEEILKLDAIASAVNEVTIKNAATGNNPIIAATGEADMGITFENDQSEEILILSAVASAVNEITIKNATTGNFPTIQATGEANTGIDFENSEDEEILKLDSIASAVNELTIKNAITTNAPIIQASGDDTNIGIELTPKGSGEVNITANDLNLSGTNPNIQISGSDPSFIIWASSLTPLGTSGAGQPGAVEVGTTNKYTFNFIDFDTATDEYAGVYWQMPTNWDGGVIQFRVIWMSTSGGSASETVEFELSGIGFADDDAVDTAIGTAVAVTDTYTATNDINITSWSGDVTLANTPSAGDLVYFKLMRDVSADNLGGDARVIGIQVKYKIAQYSN